MPTEAKRETIDDLRAQLDSSRAMIVSEYRGLKVKEISEIRRALRKSDVSYRVVKNRLMRIAAQDNAAAEALVAAPRRSDGDRLRPDEAGTAKAVLDATRPYKIVQDHGRRAGVTGDRRGQRHPAGRPAVARGPPRRGWGRSSAPLSTMAGLFDAPMRDVVGLVAALIDQRGDAAA